MLFICKATYEQLLSPKSQKNRVENFSRGDYNVVVKNDESWIRALEEREKIT